MKAIARARMHHGTAPRELGGVVVFAAFVVAVSLLGGSSRYDSGQIVMLLPLAWGAVGYAVIKNEAGPSPSGPALLLVLLGVWMIIQLIPLPFAVWRHLPGRAPLADLALALGALQPRPMSLVPWRTLHSLMTVGIPLAAALLFAMLYRRGPGIIVTGIAGIFSANLLLGILQTLVPAGSALYMYSVTRADGPVGIFSNPNHSSVFSALGMIFFGLLFLSDRRKLGRTGVRTYYAACYMLLLMVNLVNGSRAGLACTALALMATAMISHASRPTGFRGVAAKRNALALVAACGFAGLVLASFVASGRIPALNSLFAANPLDDFRFALGPTLRDMVGTYFPVGSGFGSFEKVYYISEDPRNLMPDYLNMAHNDWIQLAIEGGLPAMILLVAALGWIGAVLMRVARSGPQAKPLVIASLAGLAVIGLASWFDYPLRAPIFQCVLIWLMLIVASRARTLPVGSGAAPGNETIPTSPEGPKG